MLLLSLLPAFVCLASSLHSVVAGLINLPLPIVPKGFVTTKGTEFELDGKPFVSQTHPV